MANEETPPAPEPSNEEQARFWNGAGGERWVEAQVALDDRLARFGRPALDGAKLQAGEDVLDVGCGCGATLLEIVEQVGTDGSVLGLDVSDLMLERARERTADRDNVRVECGDAQVYPLEAKSVDLIFSRFGVMFFEDPVAAFANLRRSLRDEGRLCFLCWQGLEKNPWMAVPMSVAAQHAPPDPPPPPGSPGPLSFADPDHVRGILEEAGFKNVDLTSHTPEMHLGDTAEDAAAFLMRLGIVARMLQDKPEDLRATVEAALREALAPFASDAGIELGASTWVVTATTS